MSDYVSTRVVQELEQRLQGVPIPAAPVEAVRMAVARQQRTVRLRIAGAAALVVLAGAAGAWAWASQGRTTNAATTAATIIQGLPCATTSTSDIQPAADEQFCVYDHHEIVLWTLEKGPNQIYPPAWARTIVMGTPQKWIAGCARRADCELIQSKYGGELSTGPALGISIVVQ